MKKLYLASIWILFPVLLQAQSWSALTSGTNNTIYAMATDYDNELLYVAGKFTTAGGSPHNYIAIWDGMSWQNVPGNFDARIYALEFFNGELYAAGDFETIDNDTINKVAKWNGTSWIGFGSGFNGTVYSLEMHQDNLYAGGSFTHSDTIYVPKIAQWNGDTWLSVGIGTNLKVRALKSIDDTLYVGGAFTNAGNSTINRIAKWDGISWHSMGIGMDYDVYDIDIFQGEIYACGWFSPSPSKYISKWNGTAWVGVGGSGTNARVTDVLVLEDVMYATGTFTAINGNTLHRIAKWDGNDWTGFDQGFSGGTLQEGYALAYLNDEIYVGGDFNNASGVSSSNIAKWGTICEAPLVDWTYHQSNDTLIFNNLLEGAISWNWNFGDGNTSTSFNPSHKYNVSGNYAVCLTASSGCATSTDCDSILVSNANFITSRALKPLLISVNPNPTKGNISISTEDNSILIDNITVFDMLGNVVFSNRKLDQSKTTISTDSFPAGTYFVQATFGGITKTEKVIKADN
ncbi:T9SS type A sorting domain-containing protein [Flavobacteriales bacterium]|nr:T9SS type A sorting domain-containing protein [Flavobacteriales bacterium]